MYEYKFVRLDLNKFSFTELKPLQDYHLIV